MNKIEILKKKALQKKQQEKEYRDSILNKLDKIGKKSNKKVVVAIKELKHAIQGQSHDDILKKLEELKQEPISYTQEFKNVEKAIKEIKLKIPDSFDIKKPKWFNCADKNNRQ